MNNSDYVFKGALLDKINELFLDAQLNLTTPMTKEIAADIHEIGSIRGYMKALREVYDLCDEITKKLNDLESK